VKKRPQTAKVSFLKNEPRKPSSPFLNFEVGSVRFLENQYPKFSSDSAHPWRVAARVGGSVWPVTDANLVSMTSIRLCKCTAQIQLYVSGLGSGLLSLCCEFSFNIQTCWSSVRGCMTKLVPPTDAAILSVMHASLISSALASEYRSTDTMTRQTGVVSDDLHGRISGDRE